MVRRPAGWFAPPRAPSIRRCCYSSATCRPTATFNCGTATPSRCSHPWRGADMGLTDAERARYEWQLWVPDFGERGQEKLKAASVLVSRVGGVGGAVAQQLAVAGVGRLLLAHWGDLRANDLNRQILMSE